MDASSKESKSGARAEGGRPSRKPKDKAILQQRMPAWHIFTEDLNTGILDPGAHLHPVGGLLDLHNCKCPQIRLDYTKCHEIGLPDEFEQMPREQIDRRFRASSVGQPVIQWKHTNRSLTFDRVTKNYTMCTIDFFLPEDLQPPVLFYYQLTNFNQNHRKYLTSRNKEQLKGENVGLASLEDTCKPAETRTTIVDGQEKIVYPCGSIANSVFNDTFANPRRLLTPSDPTSRSRVVVYNMSRTGIASDLDRSLYNSTTYTIPRARGSNDGDIVPPPNWAERFPNGYHAGNMFNPAEDEAFMVWMKTAASPSFAKLAMRNDEVAMRRGMYRLEVFSHFPVHKNGGTKSILITTTSAGVSRNDFLGPAYMISGSISLGLAIIFAITTIHRPRALENHEYLHRR
ncbi:hypothetical protein ACJ41O_006348 [Fusarium nematophilum]